MQVATWLGSDVQKELNRNPGDLDSSPLSPRRLVEILSLLQSKRIHGRIAKQVLAAVFKEDNDPEAIIKKNNWEQITSPDEITTLVQAVMEENPQALQDPKADSEKMLKFFMGKVMKKSSGRVEPRLLQEQLEAVIAGLGK